MSSLERKKGGNQRGVSHRIFHPFWHVQKHFLGPLLHLAAPHPRRVAHSTPHNIPNGFWPVQRVQPSPDWTLRLINTKTAKKCIHSRVTTWPSCFRLNWLWTEPLQLCCCCCLHFRLWIPLIVAAPAFIPEPLSSDSIHFWLGIKHFLLWPSSANPGQCLVYCLSGFMFFWVTEWADMSIHCGEFPGISSTVKKNLGIKALRQLQLKNKFQPWYKSKWLIPVCN